MGLSLSHLSKDVGQFLTLPLGTDVCAQATLQEFQGTLILGNLQQFHGSLLIGSMTNNFTDQIALEFGVTGLNLNIRNICYNQLKCDVWVNLRSSSGIHADP